MTFEDWLGDRLETMSSHEYAAEKAAWDAAWDAAMQQGETGILKLRAGIVKTLEDNLELTDGDNCTLYELKKLVGWD